MKVILDGEKLENEFNKKDTKAKKRGNPLKLDSRKQYDVKEVATDSYGLYYKLVRYQKPFEAQWFYVSDIYSNENIFAKIDVYTVVDAGLTKDSLVEEGTLNVVEALEFKKEYKVTSAFYSDNLGEWLFELEGQRFPVLQKYMEITRINR
jgi:hypothetical protein